jgi:hypothetical protein
MARAATGENRIAVIRRKLDEFARKQVVVGRERVRETDGNRKKRAMK